MTPSKETIHIVGAGLAGSECAYQLAEKGHHVVLYEMRNKTLTPAHKTDKFAELVCSNSFGSQTDYSAPGQLKWEAENLGCLILKSAKNSAVPAGMALSVDRDRFADEVTQALKNHPNIEIRNEEITSLESLPRPAVIATGPLTHKDLAESIRSHLQNENETEDFLYFFDAIAPIIDADSINEEITWKGNRYDDTASDYINCPLNKEQYNNLIDAIIAARKIEPKDFEKTPYFESCMPIEVMVERGRMTPRFGPLSPKGLPNPRTERNEFAVVQLRQDNLEGTAYNMVGFQTKMAYGDQKEVFRMIPGLEEAEFLKLGSMHRNLYIHSPRKLTPILSSQKDDSLFFAGQITGVEGYFESTCIGLLIAKFLDDKLCGRGINLPPRQTAFGSLLNAITEDKKRFQPTNINFGLFPSPPEEELVYEKQGRKKRVNKDQKRDLILQKAKVAFEDWLNRHAK